MIATDASELAAWKRHQRKQNLEQRRTEDAAALDENYQRITDI